MKIIIHGGNPKKIPEIQNVVLVSTTTTMKEILYNIQLNEDITGEIWPCAKSNPELREILKLIHQYKRHQWEHTGRFVLANSRSHPVHHWFTKILEQNNIFM
jgi:aspartate/glutamate racemase